MVVRLSGCVLVEHTTDGLFERDFITRAEYKQDEFNFKKAEWDLVKANMAKEVLKTYTHVADLRKRQSDLEEAASRAIQEYQRWRTKGG